MMNVQEETILFYSKNKMIERSFIEWLKFSRVIRYGPSDESHSQTILLSHVICKVRQCFKQMYK